jgi:hypothetical protein
MIVIVPIGIIIFVLVLIVVLIIPMVIIIGNVVIITAYVTIVIIVVVKIIVTISEGLNTTKSVVAFPTIHAFSFDSTGIVTDVTILIPIRFYNPVSVLID